MSQIEIKRRFDDSFRSGIPECYLSNVGASTRELKSFRAISGHTTLELVTLCLFIKANTARGMDGKPLGTTVPIDGKKLRSFLEDAALGKVTEDGDFLASQFDILCKENANLEGALKAVEEKPTLWRTALASLIERGVFGNTEEEYLIQEY